jgi:SAM-dependent methyltransferase
MVFSIVISPMPFQFWFFLAVAVSFTGAVFQAVSIRFLTYSFPFQMLFAISLISCLAVFFTGLGALAGKKIRYYYGPVTLLMFLSFIISIVLINMTGNIGFLAQNSVFAAILFTSTPLFLGGALSGICYYETALIDKAKLPHLIAWIAVAFFAGYVFSAYLFTVFGVWNIFLSASIVSILPLFYKKRLLTAIFAAIIILIPLTDPGSAIFRVFAQKPHLWVSDGNEKHIEGFWSPYSRLDFYELSDGRLAGLYNRAQQWSVGDPEFDIAVRREIYSNIKGDVLVVGTGGGYGLLSLTEADSITAVELDPGVVRAMRGPLSKYNRNIYNEIDQIFAGDGRAFLDKTDKDFDVIIFEAADLSYSTTPRSFVSIENYLYTIEGVQKALEHLRPDGVFLILVTKELIPAPKFINALPEEIKWRLFEGEIEVMKTVPMNFDFLIASFSSDVITHWDKYIENSNLGLRSLGSDELAEKNEFGLDPITDNRPLLYFAGWHQALPFFFLLILLAVTTGVIFINSTKRKNILFFIFLGTAFMITELYVINSMRAYLGGYLETSSMLLGVLILGTAFGTIFYNRFSDKSASVLLVISVVFMMAMLFYAPLTLPVYLKIVWICFALAPASFFMGTLFPKALVRADKNHITVYYAIDTIGASAGLVLFYLLILAGGFSLVAVFGLILYTMALFMLKSVG